MTHIIVRLALTGQLKDLENQGLIHREVRVSSYPQEVFYFLTEKGVSLRELIDQIFNWGTANMLDEPSRKIATNLLINRQP